MHENDRNELINRYIDALCNEIRFRTEYHGKRVDTIYFGGGTASLIPPISLHSILSLLAETYEIIENPEITVECNPEDIVADKIMQYVSFGVNRLTLGIQTVSTRMHTLIGRSSPVVQPDIMKTFMDMKKIDHCVDLITGIPTQKTNELDLDIMLIEKYKPEHISAYILSIEKDTPLALRVRNTQEDEYQQRDSYYYFIDKCISMGYKHYEISNFAMPGHESRHNMKYWKFLPYIGFGVSSHTFYNGIRKFNNQTIGQYLKSDCPSLITDERSKNQVMAEFLMTAIRLIEGFTDDDFYIVFKECIPDVIMEKFEELSCEKLFVISEFENQKKYSLTREGLCMLDSVVFRVTEPLL